MPINFNLQRERTCREQLGNGITWLFGEVKTLLLGIPWRPVGWDLVPSLLGPGLYPWSLGLRKKKKKSHCYITASKLPASGQVPNQSIYGHVLPEKEV